MANKVKQKRRLKKANKEREKESIKASKMREEEVIKTKWRNIFVKAGILND